MVESQSSDYHETPKLYTECNGCLVLTHVMSGPFG